MMLFFFASIFMSYSCFIMNNPLLSSLSLISLSLLMSLSLVTNNFFWISYFLCLLFLSGILVIVVYISVLGKNLYFFYSINYFMILMFFMCQINLMHFNWFSLTNILISGGLLYFLLMLYMIFFLLFMIYLFFNNFVSLRIFNKFILMKMYFFKI